MTEPSTGATRATAPPPPSEPSTGQLVSDLTNQISRLVRDEARLAQAEVTQKAKRLGVGAGLFGGAGLVAFFGLAVLIAAVVLALALVVPGWLAALIVAAVYGAIAAVLALTGKNKVREAAPAVPEETLETVKEDVEWAKTQKRSAVR